jgi:hypothetical protein
MTINEEVPTLSFSRGDLMPVAFAMRTLADVLKLARERRGRAAWGDTTNVDRIEQIAEANGLRPFSPADADEWMQARESDRASVDFDRITEMTIRVAPLSGDRWGVQAGWQDNNAAAVVGSRKMADELVRWLQINSTPESIDEFRAAAGEVREAVQWLQQEPTARETTTTSAEGPSTTETRQTPLADRLRGRVSDDILDNPRWSAAEAQYSSLVAHGVDPDLLVETVACIDFTDGIRVPSGYAAWAMRNAAKNGAEPDSAVKSEEDARREVAAEWLSSADGDNPLDRARAAQLVGQLDDGFDAAIAVKFPGILDTSARDSAVRHESNARADEAAADEEDAAAGSVAEVSRLIVVSPDSSAVLPFEPFDAETETEVPHIFGDADKVGWDAARARAGDHASDATDERGHEEERQEATSETAQPTAQPTEASRDAARPLLPPNDPRQSRRAPTTTAARPRATSQPTSTRTHTRRPTA